MTLFRAVSVAWPRLPAPRMPCTLPTQPVLQNPAPAPRPCPQEDRPWTGPRHCCACHTLFSRLSPWPQWSFLEEPQEGPRGASITSSVTPAQKPPAPSMQPTAGTNGALGRSMEALVGRASLSMDRGIWSSFQSSEEAPRYLEEQQQDMSWEPPSGRRGWGAGGRDGARAPGVRGITPESLWTLLLRTWGGGGSQRTQMAEGAPGAQGRGVGDPVTCH
jgi:hypothetical protein